jgi:hypothetical protein
MFPVLDRSRLTKELNEQTETRSSKSRDLLIESISILVNLRHPEMGTESGIIDRLREFAIRCEPPRQLSDLNINDLLAALHLSVAYEMRAEKLLAWLQFQHVLTLTMMMIPSDWNSMAEPGPEQTELLRLYLIL